MNGTRNNEDVLVGEHFTPFPTHLRENAKQISEFGIENCVGDLLSQHLKAAFELTQLAAFIEKESED